MTPVEILIVETNPESGEYLAVSFQPRAQAKGYTRDGAISNLAQQLGVIVVHDSFEQGSAAAEVAAPPGEPKTQGLTWREAEQAMLQGKKVTRPILEPGYLMHDPAVHPHWALHLVDADGKEQPVRPWPLDAPKNSSLVRANLTATDWKVLPC